MTKKEAMDCLGLSGAPTKEDILNAYRGLAKKVHPDMGGTDFLFRQISEAKKILMEEPNEEKKETQKESQQKRKKALWEEVVHQPDFVFSERELEKLLLLYEPIRKEYCYRGDPYNVTVTPRNIYYENIDLKIPVTCEIYHWDSVLKWFFRRKPTKKVEHGIVSARRGFLEIAVRTIFRDTLSRGVCEVVFHVLGQRKTIRLRIGRKTYYKKKAEQKYENPLFNSILKFEVRVDTERNR